MNEQTIAFLQGLASQLETTVSDLLVLYAGQARIEGNTSIVVLSVVFIVSLLFLAIGIIMERKFKKVRNNYDFPVFLIPFIFGAVLFLSAIICFCENCTTIVTCFVNPEYWAIQELLSQFPR
jgi:hypothetical protein